MRMTIALPASRRSGRAALFLALAGALFLALAGTLITGCGSSSCSSAADATLAVIASHLQNVNQPAAFGWSLAAGDVTGDGRLDLLVGAPRGDPSGHEDAGVVFMFPCDGRGGLGSPVPVLPPRSVPEANFGRALAVADLSGDRQADLAVGAPLHPAHGLLHAGAVFLFRSSAGALQPAGMLADPLPQYGSYFGDVVVTGDASGDGLPDLLVGAPGDANGQFLGGEAFLFRSDGRGGWAGNQALAEPRPRDWGGFGNAGAIGDLTGDGAPDVVVGAFREWQRLDDPHEAFLFQGDGTGALLTAVPLTEPPPRFESLYGALALAAGDFDGDGRLDLALGAPFADVGGAQTAGETHLLLSTGGRVVLEPPAPRAGTGFGWALAAGDLTGDGLADLAVATASEQVFLWIARGGGAFDAPLELRAPGVAPDEYYGVCLLIADVTGDGAADLVVSAPQSGALHIAGITATTGEGRVFVFAGDGRGGLTHAMTLTPPP